MLYCFKYLDTHASSKLFDEVETFFKNLKTVRPSSNFNPCSQYFSNEFVTYLGSAPKLKSKFRTFFVEFCKLPAKRRLAIIKTFLTLSKVKNVLENKNVKAISLKLSKLPKGIRKPAKELFDHMYPSTLNAGKRDILNAALRPHDEENTHTDCVCDECKASQAASETKPNDHGLEEND